jgi:hypothetical protein
MKSLAWSAWLKPCCNPASEAVLYACPHFRSSTLLHFFQLFLTLPKPLHSPATQDPQNKRFQVDDRALQIICGFHKQVTLKYNGSSRQRMRRTFPSQPFQVPTALALTEQAD